MAVVQVAVNKKMVNFIKNTYLTPKFTMTDYVNGVLSKELLSKPDYQVFIVDKSKDQIAILDKEDKKKTFPHTSNSLDRHKEAERININIPDELGARVGVAAGEGELTVPKYIMFMIAKNLMKSVSYIVYRSHRDKKFRNDIWPDLFGVKHPSILSDEKSIEKISQKLT